MSQIYCLIKMYTEEAHAKAFLDSGKMYCRSLGKFKEMEGDDNRADEFEGSSHWFQPKDVMVSLTCTDGNGIVVGHADICEADLAGPMVFQPVAFDEWKLFCMYAIYIEDFAESFSTEEEERLAKEKINRSIAEQIRIDTKCENFGDYAVVILKVEQFIETVKAYARDNSLQVLHGLVKYFDPNEFTGSFNGIEAMLRKRNTYKHQKEFRFAFNTNDRTQKPLTMRLGQLNDIAFIMPSTDFNKIVIRVS